MHKRSRLRNILTKHHNIFRKESNGKINSTESNNKNKNNAGSSNNEKSHNHHHHYHYNELNSQGSKRPKLAKSSILPYCEEKNIDIPIAGCVYTVPVKIPEHPSLPPTTVKTNSADSFQCAVSPIFILAQCFGIMPLSGISKNSSRMVHFSFKSPQTIFTLMVIAACLIPCISITVFLSKIGIASNNMEGIIFYVFCETARVLFFFLATRWPHIMRNWERTESIFLHPPYKKLRRSLAQRIRPTTYTLLLLSFAEHMLYQCSEVLTYFRERKICANLNESTTIGEDIPSFGDFIHRKHAHYLNVLPYHTSTGILLLCINFVCTVVWNYMDIFILIISKGISYRFEQITLRINSLISETTIAESVFIQIREHYVKLCRLLELIEENISTLILLTCTNNLFFICYQLLKVFNKLKYTINSVYYWYSLLFLIGRSAFVLLAAATIYDESKAPLGVLRRIPSKYWCIELDRLIFEMRTQTVALSGKKFYFLTRTLVFGMAGTIVTYELVLLQFDEPNRKKSLPSFCT